MTAIGPKIYLVQCDNSDMPDPDWFESHAEAAELMLPNDRVVEYVPAAALRYEGDRRAAEMREQIALKLAAHSELLRLGDEKGPEAVATWCALAGAADIARGVPLEPPEAK